MSPIKEAIEARSLYEVTGDIKDINTVLINRAELAALRSMPAEPVAWMWEHVTNANGHVFASGFSLKKVQPTNDTFWDGYTSMRVTPLFSTPQTEPVAAEPVGWVAPRPDVVDWSSYEPDIGTPLYTTPPPAPVLSDAEILALWSGSDTALRPVLGGRKVITFARAIEQAIGRASREAK